MIRAVLITAVLVGAAACGSQPTDRTPSADVGDSATAPRTATIVCGTDGVQQAPSRVRARANGVHLRFHNAAAKKLGYGLEYADGSGQGGSIPPGKSTVALPAPVGPLEVKCGDPRRHYGTSALVIQVVDPKGHAKGATLECRGDEQAGSVIDYVEDAVGVQDVVKAARSEFADQLRSSDTVRELKYVGEGGRVVVVERDGRTIARAAFMRPEGGGWLVGSSEHCADF